MKNALFSISLLFLLGTASAQYQDRFQQEYFFGNLPSAQVEAMGRANAAVGGSLSSLYFNPAGIGLIEQQEVAFSTSAPFYVLRESDYYFAGYARRIRSNVVAAVSLNQLAIGPTSFDVNINGFSYPLDKPKSTNLALSVAVEPIEGLHVGINANLFSWKLFEDISATSTLHLDVGALYRMELNAPEGQSQRLQFGLSITNSTGASITYASPFGDESTSDFPVMARLGAAYLIGTDITLPGAGTGALDITLTGEYLNVLNSPFRTTFSLGAEARFWKVFALRMGFFNQNVDSQGFSANRDHLTDFTYGFGFQVPLPELTNGALPFALHLDYVSLKQPTYTFNGRRIPNMRTYGLRLVWTPSPSQSN